MRALLGDVEAAGLVDAHEHLVARPSVDDSDLLLDRPDAVRADLSAFRANGGGTIVEMTTIDYGRDLAALARLSADSGVHVVAATGFNKGAHSRRFCDGVDPDVLAAAQIEDVRERRCGVVKLGTSLDTIHPWEQRALEAAARTHLETGCPILTHTEAGTMAEEQLDRLESLGVAPDAVVLGHLDRNPDLEAHLRLAARGAYLSYDQLPKPKYATEPRAIAFIAELARRGLHDRVVVGGDLARRSYFTGWGGGPGLAYLVVDFARALGERFADDVLRRNPARALRMRGTTSASRRPAR